MVLKFLSFFKYSFIYYPRYGAYYGANVALENTYEQSAHLHRTVCICNIVHTSKKKEDMQFYRCCRSISSLHE